jgi:hypothetical protein
MSELKESERRFTRKQEEFICYVIGEWYFDWKHKLVNYENKTHHLGVAKEALKEMICGEGENSDE